MTAVPPSHPKPDIFRAETPFFLGCNYWTSHAGTAMWRDWRPEMIRADFEVLVAHGVDTLRVFPLWPDFQPISAITGWGQSFVEMRFGEEPLPDTPAGRAGVDEVMVERFRDLAALAEERGLRLIVGLVTGWMSGRMHVPPAFERVNVLCDPTAIKWQLRMVRYLVSRLRDCPAIVAWDLGNECNCMAPVPDADAAWQWSNAISTAVKLEDNRPVVSGMHSLTTFGGGWTIADQAETTDVLCTHPYPLFTPHCNREPVNTLRNAFHAAAETRLYGDVGNVPSFVEEAGTLGPSVCGDDIAAAFLRNILWNSYAHDCRGLLWWCAHDQTELLHAPYDWIALERALGLTRADREPKPVLKAMREFAATLNESGLATLPPFRRDAVVLLTRDQDQWGVGFASFLLAKQAGFDVEFQSADQPLKPAGFYIMPCIRDYQVMYARRFREVIAAVEQGATMLVTSDGGFLEPFGTVFGAAVRYRCQAGAPGRLRLADGTELCCPAEFEVTLDVHEAEVLGRDEHGTPAFTCRRLGLGKAMFVNLPLEKAAIEARGGFEQGFELVYRIAAEQAGVRRILRRDRTEVTLTEHPVDDHSLYAVAVNNAPEPVEFTLSPAAGWRVTAVLSGEAPHTDGRCRLPGNSGMIVRCEKG